MTLERVLAKTGWVIALGLVLVSLVYPMTRWDTPTYRYIGHLLLTGGAPYRDAIDTKSPGIFFVFAFEEWLLGNSAAGLRVFDALWQLATAGVLARVAWLLFRRRAAAACAAMVYLLTYYSQGYWTWAQPDGMLTLPLAAAVLLVEKGRRDDSLAAWFGCGFAIALAVVLKITAACCAAFAVYAVFRAPARGAWRFVVRSIAGAAGALLPLALCAGFYAQRGALKEFLFAQFQLGPLYSAAVRGYFDWNCVIPMLARIGSVPLFLAMLLAAAGILAVPDEPDSESFLRRVVWVWLLASLTAVAVQTRLLGSHWISVSGPVAVLAAACWYGLARWRSVWGRGVGLAWILLLAFALSRLGAHVAYANDVRLGRPTDDGIWRQLGQEIRSKTPEGAPLGVWGNLPVLFVYADRPSATRFLASFFTQLQFPGIDTRAMYLEDLLRTKPLYLVEERSAAAPNCDEPYPTLAMTLSSFRELQERVFRSYDVVQETETYRLLRRRPDTASGAANSGRDAEGSRRWYPRALHVGKLQGCCYSGVQFARAGDRRSDAE